MAQTLQQARTISQLLPTVKCSNCNALVPLTDLGEHICASAPPLSKPPPSPSSLLPARLQGLVSQKPRARQSNEPPPQRRGTPSINTPPPARLNSPGPPPSPFGEPNAAQLSPGWNQNRVPSPLSDKGGLGRNNIALPERTRTNSDSRMEPPRPFAERERALSTGRREPQPPPSPGFRTRTPPNDPRVAGTSRRPSFDSRPSGLFNNRRASRTHPSIDNRRPSDNRSPSAPLRPSLDSRQPNDPRAPNTPLRPSLDNRPSPATRPSIDSIRVPPRQNSYALEVGAPSSPPTVPVPPRSPVSKVEPDTKVGGDAGMAGVGRRGFAAAARAAMFATTAGHTGGVWHNKGGMDDRRPPQFLDINTVSVYSAATPPLSPNSGYSSHSPGPRSPVSPHSGHLSTSRSSTSTTKAGIPLSISRTPSPSSVNRAPFFDKFKDRIAPIDTTPLEKNRVASQQSPSTGSEHGLAYAHSTDDEEDGELVKRLPTPPPLAPKPPTEAKANLVRFPSVDEKTKSALKKSASSSSGSSGLVYGSTQQSSLSGRDRSNSAVSGSGSNYSRSTARSTHTLERGMDILFEEGSSATGSSAAILKGKNGRSNTIPGIEPTSPEHKPPKLPTRSLTTPSSAAFDESKRRKKKECVRCEKIIEDGRWIQTDAGGVLCEKCWKNMYLPKCRRCNKPIEKQAVSSSDGQLKGKYHRDCFNCHTCHKPFPDKEFYVLDGKPLCAYHYHEANESLCASCGDPIEGPCAVSHTGDRYHPEHLLCEYPGCKETLEEYWETDGKMMCERHANIVEGYGSEDDKGRWAESKAQRRVTRFMNLAGGASSDDDDSGLR